MKIGLVGYACATGLGEVNRQIATYLPIHSWLVYPHLNKGVKIPKGIGCPTLPLRDNSMTQRDIREWVSSVDIILFVETPYYTSITRYAREQNKRIVCIPMQEWQPLTRYKNPWISDVGLYLCPMTYTFDKFKYKLPCSLFKWPVDTRLFQFKPRRQFSKFVFVNGNGGYHGRKGSAVMQQALHLWPEMPVRFFTQKPISDEFRSQIDRYYKNVKVIGEVHSPEELYEEGEVLICPHTIDGLCLQPREAATCGMPNITTNGPIWEDFPRYRTIRSGRTTTVIREECELFIPEAKSLVEECQTCVEKDFTAESYEVREWAESRSWDLLKDQLLDVIISGKPISFTP